MAGGGCRGKNVVHYGKKIVDVTVGGMGHDVGWLSGG